MKKFSNTYIFLYITALVMITAIVLTTVSISLKPRQDANKQAEKAQQILQASGYKDVRRDQSVDLFQKVATLKTETPRETFDIRCADGSEGIVVTLSGKGLWGPIWGYAVLSKDHQTIKGITFSHKSETPGLGAKITEEAFTKAFVGKKLYDANGKFVSVRVVAKGKGESIDPANKVDAITGATLTSKGVDKMLMELNLDNK